MYLIDTYYTSNHWNLISVVLTLIDMIVQLLICYICLSMGSQAHLLKLKMTLLVSNRVSKVVFTSFSERKSVIEGEETFGDQSRLSFL